MAGIYLHIPFCKQACTYCNFHFSTLLKYKEDVLKAMLLEISQQAHFFPDKTSIDTIYFGGGTPSLLSAAEINEFIHQLQKYFSFSENPEITLEANPDDLSKSYLSMLKKETPVNRFSIGVQSFFDEDLQYMNRAHCADDAINSIQYAQEIGFENLSVDLIYGTPTMNNERWKKNLQTVFDLHIPHLSCYALTVEEKTILATQIKQKKSNAPSDELMAQQFTILVEAMKLHGYTHYEISNFCKEPHFARHNTNYWKGIPYLGIGAAAHSFDGIKRYWNISNNTVYVNSILNNKPARESEVLSTTDAYNEYVMTSIRTIFGTDTSKIKQDFGVEYVQHFLVEISPFIENNWVVKSDTIYTLNDSGKLFCDYITENLFLSNEE